jgi:hypothetical protein
VEEDEDREGSGSCVAPMFSLDRLQVANKQQKQKKAYKNNTIQSTSLKKKKIAKGLKKAFM